jgi:hypothetical protein
MATTALAPQRLGRRVRVGLVGILLGAAGAAWVVADLRMAGMGGGRDFG